MQTKKFETINSIVYILPSTVESTLENYLSNLDSKKVYLELRRDEDYFSIYVSSSEIYWKSRTNRQVAINKELYPLVFDLDSFFASAEDSAVVIERLRLDSRESPFVRKQITPIYDNVYMIKFRLNGEIIYEGNSM